MPILLISAALRLGFGDADRAALAAHAQPAAVVAPAHDRLLDPNTPPAWWIAKFQRPCAASGSRVTC